MAIRAANPVFGGFDFGSSLAGSGAGFGSSFFGGGIDVVVADRCGFPADESLP